MAVRRTPMRSPKTFAGALILLIGVVFAIVAGVTLDAASPVIHAALGVSFMLFAFATFDFRLPAWIAWPASLAIGWLGFIFLAQGASDILKDPTLDHFVYEQLGQRLEKILGFAFIAWCLAIALLDSRGGVKVFGLIAIAAVLAVEAFSFAMASGAMPASDALKLIHLSLFAWLLLEARRPRAVQA